MTRSQVIWLGVAHVKAIGNQKRVGNPTGAEVLIAIRAENAQEFYFKSKAVFTQNRFQMLDLSQIENEFDVPKDIESEAIKEKIMLFEKLTKGSFFALGQFYPFGEHDFNPSFGDEEE